VNKSRQDFDRGARFSITVAVVVLLAVFAANFAFEATSRHSSDVAAAQQRVSAFNRLLAEQIRLPLVEIDSVLRQLQEADRRAGEQGVEAAWEALFGAGKAGSTAVHSLIHIDAAGVIRHATEPAFVGQLAQTGKVVAALRDGATGTVMGDAAIKGPLSGSDVVPIGRRLAGRDGEYRGVVVATLDLRKLRDGIRGVNLERGSLVRVLHVGGNVLVAEGVPSAGSGAIQASVGSGRAQGLIEESDGVDDAGLITAYTALAGHPVIVAVSLQRRAVLEGWRSYLQAAGAVSAALMAALLLAVIFIRRQLEHRRLASESLRESEERYRRTFDLAGTGFAHVALDGRLLRVNRKFRKMLGYHTEEILGKTVSELTHAEDRGLADPVRARLRAGEIESGYFEKRYLRKDGSACWAGVTLVMMRAGSNEPMYEISVIEDINERKRAAEALATSERRFRALIEHSGDGVNLYDRDLKLIYRSPAGERITGRTGEEVAGIRMGELAVPEDAGAWRAAYESVAKVPGRFAKVEFRVTHKDGSVRWLEGVLTNLLDEPAVRGFVVNYRDVTERKEAEARLRESEARLRRFRIAMDVTGDAISLIDRSTLRYIDVNRTFCDMTGYAREEILGMAPFDIFSADRRTIERDYDAIIADGRSSAREVGGYYRRKDGTQVPIETRRRALETEAGWIIVATARDVSERRQAELALAASERRFRAVIENSGDAIVLYDRERRITYRSPAAARITGYSNEESANFRMGDSVLEQDKPLLEAAMERVLHMAGLAEEIHYRFRHKDGSVRWLEGVVTNLLDDPAIHSLVVNFRDVTERKQAEEQLAASELRLRRILEVNAEPTLLTDAQGIILLANAAAGELLGRSESTLAGSPLGLPLVGDRPAEVEIIRPDGEQRAAELRYARAVIGEQASLVVSLHDLSERKKYEHHIEFLANHDALTGLPNRNLLRDRAEQAILQARREGRQLALLFMDLDRFKLVNDSWGHPFGDALLVDMAGRLSAAVREGDTVARLGGDQFVILLPELKRAEDASRVADKVLASLDRPFEHEDRRVPVTGSIGIASFPRDGETLEALLQSADAAMYRAKDMGRAGFQFYSAEMGSSARERADLEAALHGALERNELALHYQPQVDLATGRIVGFEALMRWTRPGKGPVSPARFIPVAEESGLIVPMGEWALRTACRQALEWRDAGLGRYRIAVNMSARQFWQGRVSETVAAALAASGAEPGMLEIEITEGVVLRDVDEVIRSIARLREQGVSVAIDDFGTGYSSLAYLRTLPIDKLKVDKAFLKGTPEDPDACAFAAGIVQLAHVLKLVVVAEGVEQPGQAAFLRQVGCERIQGYLFSPALDAISCGALLREKKILH
jgi:diguanylate cyclase (GGDEF)-like protein/PAS domain S-box-containing protein